MRRTIFSRIHRTKIRDINTEEQKMSEKEVKITAFLSAIDRMLDSMLEVDKAWQNLGQEEWYKAVDGYPFDKDFGKIILELCEWEDKAHENLAA